MPECGHVAGGNLDIGADGQHGAVGVTEDLFRDRA